MFFSQLACCADSISWSRRSILHQAPTSRSHLLFIDRWKQLITVVSIPALYITCLTVFVSSLVNRDRMNRRHERDRTFDAQFRKAQPIAELAAEFRSAEYQPKNIRLAESSVANTLSKVNTNNNNADPCTAPLLSFRLCERVGWSFSCRIWRSRETSFRWQRVFVLIQRLG